MRGSNRTLRFLNGPPAHTLFLIHLSEGVKPAQLMAIDLEQLMQAGGTKTPMKKRSRMDMLQTPPR